MLLSNQPRCTYIWELLADEVSIVTKLDVGFHGGSCRQPEQLACWTQGREETCENGWL